MFIIQWLITITISYFLFRVALSIEIKDEEKHRREIELTDIPMLIVLIVLAIPFINILATVVVLVYSFGCTMSEEMLIKFFGLEKKYKQILSEKEESRKSKNSYSKFM